MEGSQRKFFATLVEKKQKTKTQKNNQLEFSTANLTPNKRHLAENRKTSVSKVCSNWSDSTAGRGDEAVAQLSHQVMIRNGKTKAEVK